MECNIAVQDYRVQLCQSAGLGQARSQRQKQEPAKKVSLVTIGSWSGPASVDVSHLVLHTRQPAGPDPPWDSRFLFMLACLLACLLEPETTGPGTANGGWLLGALVHNGAAE